MTGTYKVPYVPLESRVPITLQSNVQAYSSIFYTRCYIKDGIVMLNLSLISTEAIGSGWKLIATIPDSYSAATDVYFTLFTGDGLRYCYAANSSIYINGPVNNDIMMRGSTMWIQGH